jgi:hypothetical protein
MVGITGLTSPKHLLFDTFKICCAPWQRESAWVKIGQFLLPVKVSKFITEHRRKNQNEDLLKSKASGNEVQ